jgi:transcriptional regulator with XRE-family HTH domain
MRIRNIWSDTQLLCERAGEQKMGNKWKSVRSVLVGRRRRRSACSAFMCLTWVGVLAAKPDAMLKTLRRSHNLTLVHVTEQRIIPISTLANTENNQASPSYDALMRMSDAPQVDIAQLVPPPRGTPPTPVGGRSSPRKKQRGAIGQGGQRRADLSAHRPVEGVQAHSSPSVARGESARSLTVVTM